MSETIRNINILLGSLVTKSNTQLRELQSLSEDLSCLKESVRNLNDSVAGLKNSMAGLNDSGAGLKNSVMSLNDSLRSLHEELTQHKEQSATTDASTQQMILHINRSLSSLGSISGNQLIELQSLSQEQSSLKDSVASLNDSVRSLREQLTEHEKQTATTDTAHFQTSFTQLHQSLTNNLTHQLETIGDRVDTLYDQRFTCGGTGGWRRAVYLDMTDPSTTCPSGWQLTGYSKQTCGRASHGTFVCDSVSFPVSGGEYNKVCGRIKAYQWGSPDGFYPSRQASTMDSGYIDGVSVTHGNPRQHIWTFAAGLSEDTSVCPQCACPCDTNSAVPAPAFVGEDYFCESGLHEPWAQRQYVLFANDPLWDGQNCPSSSTCCSLHNPPYFVKQLPSSAAANIEARICLDQQHTDEDIAVELVELYVQ